MPFTAHGATRPQRLLPNPQQGTDLGLDTDIHVPPGRGANEYQAFHHKPPSEECPNLI